MKDYYKITPTVFVSLFFSLYTCCFLAGYSLFYWKPISLIAALSIFLFISGVLFGTAVGQRIKLSLNYKKIPLTDRFVSYGWFLLTLCILLSFVFMIKKYGSISYIISHAFLIRESVIGGEGFIPFYLSYINSLNQAFFAISLVSYKRSGKVFYSIAFFINIIFCDLLTFGRVGTLFGIFVLVSFLFFNKGFKLFNFRLFIYSVFAFFVLNLSRIIRGGDGGFSSSVTGLVKYLKVDVPEWSYGLLSNYTYYFSSPIAFSEYLYSTENFNSSFGQRLFTPIYNILLRFTGESRINTIDPFVNVPYSTNIYTVLRDIYADLGVFGIIPYSFIFGLTFALLYNCKGFFYKSLFLMFAACVFFFPLYNALSFGMFMISMFFLFFLSLFFKVKV